MTSGPNQPNALAELLQTLARDCSSLGVSGESTQRLVEILSPASVDSLELSDCRLSLESALSLISGCRELLGNPAVPGFGPETTSGLDRALTSLAGELGVALRRQQAHRVRGLYVIIDPQVTGGRPPLEVATAAVRGGAKMLQLRDKLRDKGESLPLAQDLQDLCAANDVLLIINDHLDLAMAVGSGGAHVGQTDLPVAQARHVLAPHQVLGRSNREFQQLAESQELGADHVAFGPIYQTDTKSIVRNPQGPDRLKQAREVAKVPLVAIGGINAANVGPVVQAGADAICVTAAVGAAPDPEAAASQLVQAIQQAGGKT